MLSNLKVRRTNIGNQLIWHCLDYGTLRKEHSVTIDFINRYEKFKGSLAYNLKVLLPESLSKLAQVTLRQKLEELKENTQTEVWFR